MTSFRFFRKCFCALGLGLRLWLELAEIRLNMLSVKRPVGHILQNMEKTTFGLLFKPLSIFLKNNPTRYII